MKLVSHIQCNVYTQGSQSWHIYAQACSFREIYAGRHALQQ